MAKAMVKASLLASVMVLGASIASAQDMTIKFSHAFPATHKQWEQGGGFMANLLAEASGGSIKFEQYPAAQLGKESTSIIGSGLAQAGVLAPSYEPEKLLLSSVSELPGLSGSSCEGSAKLWHLVKEGGIIDEQELKPLGLRAVYVNVAPQYSLVTTAKEVTSLEDLQGLKIRANGAAMDRTARVLGATPLAITGGEFFDSLTRGTVDGGFWSIESVRPWGLENTLKYIFDGAKMGTATTLGVVNRKFWDGLDEETRQKFTDAGMATQVHFCEWYDAQIVSEAKWLTDGGYATINTPSEEESATWDAQLDTVSASWAKDLDDTGRPGTEVLEAFRQAPSEF